VPDANGAEYEARRKREAKAERVAPGYQMHPRSTPERPKYKPPITPFSGLYRF